jgi:hypothetical protein
MTRLRATTLSLCCFLVLSVTSDIAHANEHWSITVYNAVLTAWDLETVVKFEAEFEDDYQLWALAVAKKVGSFTEHMDIEIEGQIVQHTGEQNYMEFSRAPSPPVRWCRPVRCRWIQCCRAGG